MKSFLRLYRDTDVTLESLNIPKICLYYIILFIICLFFVMFNKYNIMDHDS